MIFGNGPEDWSRIINMLAVGVTQVSRDLRYQKANIAAARLLNTTPERIIGRSVEDVIGPEALAAIRPYIERVLSGEVVEYESQLPYLTGLRDMQVVYHPWREQDGSVSGWVATLTDITERKRQESALAESKTSENRERTQRERLDLQLSEIETLYRTAPIGLMMHDRDLRCVRMNEMIAQINGVPIEASVGRQVHEFLPADLADRVERILRSVLDTGEAVIGLEMQGQTATGIPSSWLVSYHPVRDRSGEVVGVQAVVQDISAQVRAMESARLAQEEADRANQAKSRFLAYATHDLRQPLHAALLHLEELYARIDKPEKRELCNLTRQSFDAVMEILNALVDVSALERGQVRVHVRDVDVQEMIEEVIDEHRSQADQNGLRLTARNCEGFVRSDPTLLKRVVDNFVSNAIRYTDAGEITVHCHRDDSRLRISVSDTGRGIPADKLETIFEEYVQLDNPGRAEGKGLGLGLAIVRHIANILGHRIEVTSSLGKGSTFSVEIPG
jgi:PAS domain S-box-containing protein